LIDAEILLQEKVDGFAEFFPTAQKLLVFDIGPDNEVDHGLEDLNHSLENDGL
jgi:hypothetical protein